MTRTNYGALKAVPDALIAKAWMQSDVPIRKIATALGVTHQAVYQRAKRLALPARNTMRPVKADLELLDRMWNAGVKGRDIADYFGYANGTISHLRKKRKLAIRERRAQKDFTTLEQFFEGEMAEKMRAA